MFTQLLGRSILALIAGFAAMDLVDSAAATGSSAKRVIVTCPGGQEPNGDTFHQTAIQVRNITGRDHAFFVRSVKIYAQNGALLKNMPSPDPLPPNFSRNPVAHSTTTLATSSVFGPDTTALAVTVVFDIQYNSHAQPFLITDIHRDLRGTDVVGRAEYACIIQSAS